MTPAQRQLIASCAGASVALAHSDAAWADFFRKAVTTKVKKIGCVRGPLGGCNVDFEDFLGNIGILWMTPVGYGAFLVLLPFIFKGIIKPLLELANINTSF